MWHLLTFNSARHETDYMHYIERSQAGAMPWRLMFSAAASLVAFAKLVLLLAAEHSIRWRAFSVCLFQAVLVAALLAVTFANSLQKPWLAAKHERTSVLLEILATVVTFWGLLLLQQSELLPEQTPFASFVCRGYLLALGQVRLAPCVPVLLLEAFAFVWLELTRHTLKGSLTIILRYLLLGQVVPLAAILYFEIQYRWQFMQHCQLDASTAGCWAVMIEFYMLAANGIKQQARKLQQAASSWPVLVFTAALVIVAAVAGATVINR